MAYLRRRFCSNSKKISIVAACVANRLIGTIAYIYYDGFVPENRATIPNEGDVSCHQGEGMLNAETGPLMGLNQMGVVRPGFELCISKVSSSVHGLSCDIYHDGSRGHS